MIEVNRLSVFCGPYYFEYLRRNEWTVFFLHGSTISTVAGNLVEDERNNSSEFFPNADCPELTDVTQQFELFKNRPEYYVGKKVEVGGKRIDELMNEYELRLAGAFLCRKHSTVLDPGCVPAIEWLRTTDFYTAPASTQFHESYPGGLLVHTLQVYNQMCDLIQCNQFKNVNIASATLATLCHDWCKIDLYEPYKRNVKEDGQWKEVDAFKRNQRGIPMGHGASSMFLISRFTGLAADEALAIRWHQGRWNVCREEMNEFQLANEKFPLVHLVQFSDQLAITDYV